jgi:hypothetical protein
MLDTSACMLQDERDGLRAAAAMATSGGSMSEARQQEREELLESLQVLTSCVWNHASEIRRSLTSVTQSRVSRSAVLNRLRANLFRGGMASWRPARESYGPYIGTWRGRKTASWPGYTPLRFRWRLTSSTELVAHQLLNTLAASRAMTATN